MKISAPIRFWAASCLVIWLLGSSAEAFQQFCSCCNGAPAKRAGCDHHEMSCGASGAAACANEDSGGCGGENQSCGIRSGCPMTLIEPNRLLPIEFSNATLIWGPAENAFELEDRISADNSKAFAPRDSRERLIPDELRLGSTLWSHAPPTAYL